MKKSILHITLVAFLTITAFVANAQQAPIFTNYEYSYTTINPGFGGLSDGVNIMGIYRDQWSGFEDVNGNRVSPRTFVVSGDMPIQALAGGLSFSVMKDAIAFEDNINLNLGYSYHMDLGSGTLGLGLALALDNRTMDFSKAIVIDENDPVLPKSSESDMLFDANIGAYYTVPETFYAGVAVTSLLKTKGKALSENSGSSSASFVGDRTFYLMAGYYIQMPDPRYIIEPSMCLLSNIAATQINLSAKVLYNKKFWMGVNYRHKESVGILAGLGIKDFRLNYSYDINIMGLAVKGSHEFAVSYIFKLDLEKSPRIYHSIRYL